MRSAVIAFFLLFALKVVAQSDFDPLTYNEILNVEEQIEQLQRQQAAALAKYNEDVARYEAQQEQARQNQLRQLQAEEQARKKEQDKIRDRELWSSSAPAIIAYVPSSTPIPTPISLDEKIQHLQEFVRQLETSDKQAKRIYPDLSKTGSPLSEKVAEITKILKAQDNPILHQSDAPLKIAQMAANELGIAPKP